MLIIDQQKIRSFSAASNRGRHIVKIEIEYDQVYNMAYDIERLEELKAQQTVKPSRKSAKPLALPAPDGGDS